MICVNLLLHLYTIIIDVQYTESVWQRQQFHMAPAM